MQASSNNFVIFFCFSAVAMCNAVSPFCNLYKHIRTARCHAVKERMLYLQSKGCRVRDTTNLLHTMTMGKLFKTCLCYEAE